MRTRALVLLVFAGGLIAAAPADGEPRPLSEAECTELRRRVGEHARLSGAVRRAVAAQVARQPAAAAPAPATPPSRAEQIRARLGALPGERQRLEDQRLGAMLRLDFPGAADLQGRIDRLAREKVALERELASLPASAPAPAPATPAPAAPAPALAPAATGDADRLACPDVTAALEAALKTRRRELGAKEDLPGAVPLLALRGQGAADLAQEIGAQLASGPDAAGQVGLLDQDGDGRLDGFVDVPADGVFRLHRLRTDGSISIEVFAVPGKGGVGEMTRRLGETLARTLGRSLGDLLAAQPAGPIATLAETGTFARMRGHWLAGEFGEAGRQEAAARTVEYPNLRGESVRVLELYAPALDGVRHRTLVLQATGPDQVQREELTISLRPISYWRTEGEVTLVREIRGKGGAPAGPATTKGPARFTLER
jgi:hypothetical protein